MALISCNELLLFVCVDMFWLFIEEFYWAFKSILILVKREIFCASLLFSVKFKDELLSISEKSAREIFVFDRF